MDNLLDLLSHDVINKIYDFADINAYWKRRMTNDILIQIDKNYRLVRYINDYYNHFKPCLHCYFHSKKNIFCSGCRNKNTHWGVLSILDLNIKYYDLHFELLYYCKIQKFEFIEMTRLKNMLIASIKTYKYLK